MVNFLYDVKGKNFRGGYYIEYKYDHLAIWRIRSISLWHEDDE